VAARQRDARAGLPDAERSRTPENNGAPGPLSHATPDSELVEAQLAMGRGGPADDVQTPEEERELEQLATGDSSDALAGPEAAPGRRGDRGSELAEPGASSEVAVPGAASPARKPSPVSRLVTFMRGSWAELQRVQWPDRRQVMQATGVVVGFVIVAGVYLGLADWAAGKIMDFILK
jgi:preprotein translocase SecE subunit